MSIISNEQVKEATLRYMNMSGFDIVDDDFDGCIIVAVDTQERAIAFTTYAAALNEMPHEEFDRGLFELRAARFLMNNPEYTDIVARADEASLCVIENNRALLKYTKNVSR